MGEGDKSFPLPVYRFPFPAVSSWPQPPNPGHARSFKSRCLPWRVRAGAHDMRKLVNNVKRVNAILWTGNILLIIGIVAFAFQFLIFQDILVHEVDPPISIPPSTGR